ncbi:MAG: hypothetical protein Q9181_004012 [Wetmoreana brouardii]
MADISLYNEVPRPYRPRPKFPWSAIQPEDHEKIQGGVKLIFDELALIVEPLEVVLSFLQSYRNMDDLFRKLKCYAEILRPILDWEPTDPVMYDQFDAFDRTLEKLGSILKEMHAVQDLENEEMPVIPLTDLLVAVFFDSRCGTRRWTTVG